MKGMIPPTVLLLLKLNKTAQPCRAFRGKGKHSELLPKRSCDAVPNTNTYGEGEREKREREREREREKRERERKRERAWVSVKVRHRMSWQLQRN